MQAQSTFHLSDADFTVVQKAVHKHCGIALSEEKKSLVRARLTKLIRASGFETASEYLDYVLADGGGGAFTEFIDALSTNLTSFFREAQHFQFLGEVALTEILQKKQKNSKGALMAWSAGCSSGEEPYSIAMTVLDTIGRQRLGTWRWDFRLLATDISTRMLEVARTGIYSQRRLAGLPPGYRAQYFSVAGNVQGTEAHYEVAPELRHIVRYRRLNLMDHWPFNGQFDFIFCRNVMIYFDHPTQQRLVQRMWSALRPGGFLFVGHSESLAGSHQWFVNRQPSIYEKRI